MLDSIPREDAEDLEVSFGIFGQGIELAGEVTIGAPLQLMLLDSEIAFAHNEVEQSRCSFCAAGIVERHLLSRKAEGVNGDVAEDLPNLHEFQFA